MSDHVNQNHGFKRVIRSLRKEDETKTLINEMLECLILVAGDVEWRDNSPTLKYIDKCIKKAKKELSP